MRALDYDFHRFRKPYHGGDSMRLIIMDEIGCGIIPLEKSERLWREAVGNVGCFLAERAEGVERIICGTAVRIK